MEDGYHAKLVQQLLQRIHAASAETSVKRDVLIHTFDKRLREALSKIQGGRILAKREALAAAIEKVLWITLDEYEALVEASLVRYEAYRAFFAGSETSESPLILLGLLDDRGRQKTNVFDPNPSFVKEVLEGLFKDLGKSDVRRTLEILDARTRVAVTLADPGSDSPDLIHDVVSRVEELMADAVTDEEFGFPLEQTLDLLAGCLELAEEADASIH